MSREQDLTIAGDLAYRQALGKARSIAGVLNVKRKRKRLIEEQTALRDENFDLWFGINRRKRIIATPMSAIKKTMVVLRRARKTVNGCKAAAIEQQQQQHDSSSEEEEEEGTMTIPVKIVTKMLTALESIEQSLNKMKEGIGPMAMAMKQCTIKQQEIESRVNEIASRNNQLNRALVRASQEIFNTDQIWLYANGDYASEILPTSMYQLKTWHRNKRARKQREASAASSSSARGNTSGNVASNKPLGKSQTIAKRFANRERQDMGNSMVDHVPVCVADPTSYAGLAGVVAENKETINLDGPSAKDKAKNENVSAE